MNTERGSYTQYIDNKKVIKDGPRVDIIETDMTVKRDEDLDSIEYIEKYYPETAKDFKQIQEEQYELFCKKQRDYGPRNISVGTDLKTNDDIKLSLTGLWFRIQDKIERLKQLVVFDKTAQNEPMIDAFKDLSVYGIIAQIVHNGRWGK